MPSASVHTPVTLLLGSVAWSGVGRTPPKSLLLPAAWEVHSIGLAHHDICSSCLHARDLEAR